MKKVIKVFAILLVILTMSACAKKSDSKRKVGDTYQGGIIFYVLKAGDTGYDSKVIHGLIASTKDQDDSAGWDSYEMFYSKSVPGTLTSIGSGSANTDKIIAQNGKGTDGWPYAAKVARDYQGGGYSDWYLPSKDELDELYKQKDIVGGTNSGWYWSSSEYDASKAWHESFLSGKGGKDFQSLSPKYQNSQVRAIRSF